MEFSFVDATGFDGRTGDPVSCHCHNKRMRYVEKHGAVVRNEFQCRENDNVVAYEIWSDGKHEIRCACHSERIETDGTVWRCSSNNEPLASVKTGH
jgi:hypothetical protein